MRVEQLYVRGFGPFDELQLDFKPKQAEDKADIHILTGRNGTGKSTILYAIAAALSAAREDMFDWNLFTARRRSAFEVELATTDLTIRLQNAGAPLVRTSRWQSRSLNIAGEGWAKVLTSNPGGTAMSFRDRQPLSFAAFAYAGGRTIGSSHLAAIAAELTESPLEASLSFANTARSDRLVQWIANTKAKKALAKERGDLEAAGRREEAVARIEEAVSRIVDQDVRFELNDEPLEVRLTVDGAPLSFDVLPDGLKSIVSWIADLLMRLDRIPWENDTPVLDRPFLLLLDEIDIHLHPAWQRKILPVVQTLFPKAQIIVSTHSPFVVGSIRDAWVYPLALRDGQVRLDEPMESQAGSSFASVLKSVFGIEEEFDVETEKLFRAFYDARNQVLKGDTSRRAALDDAARKLTERGDLEVTDIVQAELRQINRRTAPTGTG